MVSNKRSTFRYGESVTRKSGTWYRSECCDCGLVHKIMMTFDPTNSLVSEVSWRDDDATKASRKKSKRKKKGKRK